MLYLLRALQIHNHRRFLAPLSTSQTLTDTTLSYPFIASRAHQLSSAPLHHLQLPPPRWRIFLPYEANRNCARNGILKSRNWSGRMRPPGFRPPGRPVQVGQVLGAVSLLKVK